MQDFLRFDVDILVECKCGKRRVFKSAPILLKFQRKRWSYDLESAKMRFRCLGCRKYASRISAAF